MAKDETKSLAAETLKADADALAALKNISDYTPANADFTLVNFRSAFSAAEARPAIHFAWFAWFAVQAKMNRCRSRHQFKLREFYGSLRDNFFTSRMKAKLAMVPAFNLMRTVKSVG